MTEDRRVSGEETGGLQEPENPGDLARSLAGRWGWAAEGHEPTGPYARLALTGAHTGFFLRRAHVKTSAPLVGLANVGGLRPDLVEHFSEAIVGRLPAAEGKYGQRPVRGAVSEPVEMPLAGATPASAEAQPEPVERSGFRPFRSLAEFTQALQARGREGEAPAAPRPEPASAPSPTAAARPSLSAQPGPGRQSPVAPSAPASAPGGPAQRVAGPAAVQRRSASPGERVFSRVQEVAAGGPAPSGPTGSGPESGETPAQSPHSGLADDAAAAPPPAVPSGLSQTAGGPPRPATEPAAQGQVGAASPALQRAPLAPEAAETGTPASGTAAPLVGEDAGAELPGPAEAAAGPRAAEPGELTRQPAPSRAEQAPPRLATGPRAAQPAAPGPTVQAGRPELSIDERAIPGQEPPGPPPAALPPRMSAPLRAAPGEAEPGETVPPASDEAPTPASRTRAPSEPPLQRAPGAPSESPHPERPPAADEPGVAPAWGQEEALPPASPAPGEQRKQVVSPQAGERPAEGAGATPVGGELPPQSPVGARMESEPALEAGAGVSTEAESFSATPSRDYPAMPLARREMAEPEAPPVAGPSAPGTEQSEVRREAPLATESATSGPEPPAARREVVAREPQAAPAPTEGPLPTGREAAPQAAQSAPADGPTAQVPWPPSQVDSDAQPLPEAPAGGAPEMPLAPAARRQEAQPPLPAQAGGQGEADALPVSPAVPAKSNLPVVQRAVRPSASQEAPRGPSAPREDSAAGSAAMAEVGPLEETLVLPQLRRLAREAREMPGLEDEASVPRSAGPYAPPGPLVAPGVAASPGPEPGAPVAVSAAPAAGAIQRSPLAAGVHEERPPAPPTPAAAAERSPLIQRAVGEPEAGSAAEPAPEPASGAGPDLDQLARSVYPLLKRMLAVERERRTGRRGL